MAPKVAPTPQVLPYITLENEHFVGNMSTLVHTDFTILDFYATKASTNLL